MRKILISCTEIKEAYGKFGGVAKTAEHFGCSMTTIYQFMHEYKLPLIKERKYSPARQKLSENGFKKFRARMGFTQSKITKLLGVQFVTYRSLEYEQNNPSFSTIMKLLKIGMTIEELFNFPYNKFHKLFPSQNVAVKKMPRISVKKSYKKFRKRQDETLRKLSAFLALIKLLELGITVEELFGFDYNGKHNLAALE
jgi:DNA-binding XRE family transcriptional regulator